MAGYIGSKAVLLSTTAAVVTGDADIGGDLTVDTNTLFVDAANNRVGVGTSSPKNNLDVAGSTGIYQRHSSGGRLVFDDSDTADASTPMSYISNTAGALQFGRADRNASTGLTTNSAESMRIDSSGNLLLAKTSFTNAGAGHIFSTETVDGAVHRFTRANNTGTQSHARFITNAGSTIGSITTTTTATAYNTSSDYRLKENVVPLAGAADRLAQIPVHRFNFIADPDRTVDGFLAHEVQEIVPECVTGTKDEVDADGNPVYQGIDQSKLVPLLTAALQEALTKIDALEARIVTLEGGAA